VCCCNSDAAIIQSFQNIQRLYLEYGKGINMTIIVVTSIKKEISRFQEDSAQFTTKKKSDPQLTVRTAQRNVWTPICVREDSEQLSIDSMQPSGRQGNIIRTRRLKFNEETREARYGSRLLMPSV
jgi:hypothetical protein